MPESTRVFVVRPTVQSSFGPELEVAWCLIATTQGTFLHPLAWETRNGPMLMAYRLEQ